tara:strand:+ start:77 stop:706 length:630 start_codon:yes stop_codon:yes gene_type:complete
MIRIKKAAHYLGVHPDTLRRWVNAGKVKARGMTPGGHRLFDINDFESIVISPTHRVIKKEKPTLAYARVSSRDQKKDLKKQVELLELFCSSNGFKYELVKDLGSGMNFNKKGLKKLISMLCNREIGRIVVTHKDRLLRFGSELIFTLCSHFGCELVIINSSEETTYEEDLAQDVLEIITVFSARLYGSRSHKNKKIVEKLKEAADEVCR